jgi:hypothetical protein
MKKDLNEILKNITPDTPIDDVLAYCDSIEDLQLILASMQFEESEQTNLSDEIIQAAFALFENSKLTKEQITTAYIQRNLNVSYPQAVAIVDLLAANN